jgi:metal-responsive CopG/Arc/MetJ family transcriptional regulator
MRTLIDIPQPDLENLDALSAKRNLPRAAVVREAIAEYLARHAHDSSQAFGLWGEQKRRDGVAYQRKVRAEW